MVSCRILEEPVLVCFSKTSNSTRPILKSLKNSLVHYNAVVGVLSGDHVIDEARYCEVTAESHSQYSSHSVLVQYCGKSTGSESTHICGEVV